MSSEDEIIEYEGNPGMFSIAPFRFILVLILCFAVIGIPVMIIWRVVCKNTKLTVTNKRVLFRTGVLSKKVIELRHSHIRSVVVSQSLLNRFMNVGTIAVASAASGTAEIEVAGMKAPYTIRDIIQKYQS